MRRGARILIFARAPVPGSCKTRLMPAVGARGAARVQRQLLEKTLETTVGSGLAPVELCCAPDSRHPALLRARAEWGISLHRQTGSDLGQRMSHALHRTLRSPGAVVLVGTDCPALTPSHLRDAFNALRAGNDFVFIPADDGGYVLVGAQVSQPRVFQGIAWGSDSVMAATRARLSRLRLKWLELPALWDVDSPSDLRRAEREQLL
jgi:rSAM/selenodomain-associated transferase 1